MWNVFFEQKIQTYGHKLGNKEQKNYIHEFKFEFKASYKKMENT